MRTGSFIAAIAAALLAISVASAAEIKPFGRGSWRAILNSHAGRSFIVHFWGLTCGPCRRELPSWGRLLAASPGLRLVTINADLVPNDVAEAEEFLVKSGLDQAENFIFDDNFAERLRYEIDPTWQGEIPVTLLIGRDGSTTKIEGTADMTEVRSWLEKQALSSDSSPNLGR